MIERTRKLFALGLALTGLVLALLLPQVVVGERTVTTNAVATAPGTPPSEPDTNSDDDTSFYPDAPYDPELCAQRGEPHEYTRDEPKESTHSFGPALGGLGTDDQIVGDFFVHLCGEGGPPDQTVGPDRVYGRALMAVVFGIDPNQPFDSTWREDQRHLVLSIDWMSIKVERGKVSGPGTWSMYMYVDESGTTRVGVDEVEPRRGTYLVMRVYVDEISYVDIRLRVDCGGQPDLTLDQIPTALK